MKLLRPNQMAWLGEKKVKILNVHAYHDQFPRYDVIDSENAEKFGVMCFSDRKKAFEWDSFYDNINTMHKIDFYKHFPSFSDERKKLLYALRRRPFLDPRDQFLSGFFNKLSRQNKSELDAFFYSNGIIPKKVWA